MVETVDAVDGLPEGQARILAKRMWYLGWFGLPLLWFVNAYYFWPHLSSDDDDAAASAAAAATVTDDAGLTADDGASRAARAHSNSDPNLTSCRDPVIRHYALMSLRGAQASGVVVAAWAVTFLAGGKTLFGEETWAALSITAQPPLE